MSREPWVAAVMTKKSNRNPSVALLHEGFFNSLLKQRGRINGRAPDGLASSIQLVKVMPLTFRLPVNPRGREKFSQMTSNNLPSRSSDVALQQGVLFPVFSLSWGWFLQVPSAWWRLELHDNPSWLQQVNDLNWMWRSRSGSAKTWVVVWVWMRVIV